MKIVIIDNIEDLNKEKIDLLLFRCPYCKKITVDIDGHFENCIKDPLGLMI
jgi:hypothetical protein